MKQDYNEKYRQIILFLKVVMDIQNRECFACFIYHHRSFVLALYS